MMMHNPASPGELLREFLGDRPVGEFAATHRSGEGDCFSDSQWTHLCNRGFKHPFRSGPVSVSRILQQSATAVRSVERVAKEAPQNQTPRGVG